MKKFYILLGALCTVAFANAQAPQSRFGNVQYKPQGLSEAERATASQVADVEGPRGGTTILFAENFANGLAGNNGFGPMVVEDSGTTPIWSMADATAPNGQFATGIAALASPTAANGWVIFDADAYNNPVSNGVEDVNGTLTTPTLDFSNSSSVVVEWYQYFRYCCFSPSPLTLEVSNDGGLNWFVFPGQGTFTPSANTISANPLRTVVDISCAAANQSSVLVRWGYNTAGEAGYSHYFWGIDDISIYENPINNDLEIFQVLNGDIINVWEYRVTPLAQAPLAADGGLLAGVVYKNNGFNDQTNCTMTIEVLNAAQEVLYSSVENLQTVPAYGNSPECPSFIYDTLYVETGWVPEASGSYFIRATIGSDSTDVIPGDNVKLKDIEYTAAEYGHDNGDSLDIQLGPRANEDDPNLWDPHGYGNFYHFPYEGSEVYGLSVRFGSNSDAPANFNALLIKTNGNLNESGEPVGSEEFEMTQGWIDSSQVALQYFPFGAPVSVVTGDAYFGCILIPDVGETRVTILAQDNSDTDNSTGSFEQSGDGDFVWFGAQNWTPAIRLVLEQRVGINELPEVSLENFSVSPNPAVDVARVSFTLQDRHAVAYEIRDIQGRLVQWSNLGNYQPGQNILNIEVNDLPAGQYSVGIVLDGEHMFRQNLLVVR